MDHLNANKENQEIELCEIIEIMLLKDDSKILQFISDNVDDFCVNNICIDNNMNCYFADIPIPFKHRENDILCEYLTNMQMSLIVDSINTALDSL